MPADKKKESGNIETKTDSVIPWINRKIVVVMIGIYATGLFTVLYVPQFEPALIPEGTFWLFGLSMQAVLLLMGTGTILYLNWIKTKYPPLRTWSVAFFMYSITFLGLLFYSLGYIDEKNPFVFFLFRNSMIVWAAFMIQGLSTHLGFDKRIRNLSSIAILVFGYLWFIWGLLVTANIEYTMYGFLYFLFIPVTVYLSWAFRIAAKRTGFSSFNFISLGMAGLTVTYGAWAPWHLNYIYAVWFFMFNMSLVSIFAGYAGLLQESKYLKLIRMRIPER